MSQKKSEPTVTLYLKVKRSVVKEIGDRKPDMVSRGVFAGHLLEMGLLEWKRAGAATPKAGKPPALPSS